MEEILPPQNHRSAWALAWLVRLVIRTGGSFFHPGPATLTTTLRKSSCLRCCRSMNLPNGPRVDTWRQADYHLFPYDQIAAHFLVVIRLARR
jgi:hypothetical protein